MKKERSLVFWESSFGVLVIREKIKCMEWGNWRHVTDGWHPDALFAHLDSLVADFDFYAVLLALLALWIETCHWEPRLRS